MHRAAEVSPPENCAGLLPGHSFADSFRVRAPVTPLDARDAATAIFASSPLWITALRKLRDRLARMVGLRTVTGGAFPVFEEGPARVVLGLDDRHLDFRLVVDVAADCGESEVTVTTLVRLNNWLGRVYLVSILPFHRAIVRTSLERAVFG